MKTTGKTLTAVLLLTVYSCTVALVTDAGFLKLYFKRLHESFSYKHCSYQIGS